MAQPKKRFLQSRKEVVSNVLVAARDVWDQDEVQDCIRDRRGTTDWGLGHPRPSGSLGFGPDGSGETAVVRTRHVLDRKALSSISRTL